MKRMFEMNVRRGKGNEIGGTEFFPTATAAAATAARYSTTNNLSAQQTINRMNCFLLHNTT